MRPVTGFLQLILLASSKAKGILIKIVNGLLKYLYKAETHWFSGRLDKERHIFSGVFAHAFFVYFYANARFFR